MDYIDNIIKKSNVVTAMVITTSSNMTNKSNLVILTGGYVAYGVKPN